MPLRALRKANDLGSEASIAFTLVAARETYGPNARIIGQITAITVVCHPHALSVNVLKHTGADRAL